MSQDVRQTLHEAAPRPSSPAPFERLWTRGRRRRAATHSGGAIAALAAIGLVAVVLPGALAGDGDDVRIEVTDQPDATCPVTDAAAEPFTPPDPYPPTPVNDDAVWYGTPELWTVVSDTPGDQKSVWWSIDFEGGPAEERPDIEIRYQQLDDPDREPIVRESPGTNAHTADEGRFMINGLQPNEPGCWQVTATYRDAELSYVYLVEEPADDRAGSPTALTEACTEEQLADRRAAEEELATLIESAGYEPSSTMSHVNILDEDCDEIDVQGLEASIKVGGETVRLVWDGPARLSSERPETTAPPQHIGDVTVQQSDHDNLGTWMWFACGEAQVSLIHDVLESDDLADDPRSRRNVDPWDSDPELLADVAQDFAEVVMCPAGLLHRDR